MMPNFDTNVTLLTMLCVVQVYLKRCCSLCEAVVVQSLLYSATNIFAYALIEHWEYTSHFFLFVLLLYA